MSFIMSILKGIHSASKVAKKLGKARKLASKDVIKVIRDSLLTFAISGLLIVTIIGGALYSVTGAVSDMFNKIQGWFGSSSQPPSSYYSGLTSEQIKQLIDETGASLDASKIPQYMQKQAESVPASKQGTKQVITGSSMPNSISNIDTQSVNIDISSYANKYKVNWEFLASIDLATFNADNRNEKTAVNNANSLFPVFSWNEKYTRDTTDTSRSWKEKYEYDPTTGETKQLENTYNSTYDTYVTTKEPLAIPDKVTTMFGDYIYSVNENVIIKETDFSKPYIQSQQKEYKTVEDKLVEDKSKPIYETEDVIKFKGSNEKEYRVREWANRNIKQGIDSGEITDDGSKIYKYIGTDDDWYVYENGWLFWKEKLLIYKDDIPENEANQDMIFSKIEKESVFTGSYEKKMTYKTLTITTNTMKKTKQKIVEDQVANIRQNFDPTKFVRYLNSCNLSTKDLELVKECLINIPNSNYLLETIDRIINGDYGDIGTGGNDTNGSGGQAVTMDGVIPLFLQGDPRWANLPYSDNTIGAAGCGVTSMAMVVNGLGGDINAVKKYDSNNDGILDPGEVARYSTENGHSTHREGTMRSLYGDLGTRMGLRVTEAMSSSQVYEALRQGKIVISSMTPGHFTRGSHILVLTGLASDGKVVINDPASAERSKLTWDFSIVSAEADAYWIVENPNFNAETFLATSYYSFTFEDAKKIGTESAMADARLQGGSEYTASGLFVGDKDLRDKIIAVDKNLIPLGSKVYITFPNEIKQAKMPDGTVVNLDGYYSAQDTGGAIKGNHIDLYTGAWSRSPEYKNIALKVVGSRNVTIRYRKR